MVSKENLHKPGLMLHWLWIAGAVLVSDQITKILANIYLEYHRPVEVFTGLNMTLSFNPGAAFSFLSDAGGWQRWFFTVLAIGVTIFLIRWMRQLKSTEVTLAIALSLIVGGAIGNVIDRIYLGHVVDFIDVYYFAESCVLGFGFNGVDQCHWPIFNIADSAIFIGAFLFIFDGFRRKDESDDTESKVSK